MHRRSGEKFYTNAHKHVYDMYFYDTQEQPTYNFLYCERSKAHARHVQAGQHAVTSYTIDKAVTIQRRMQQ
jgi:hypothetical protein